MRKVGFSFAKHKSTGSTLKKVRRELLALSVSIANSYPSSFRGSCLAKKTVAAVDALRSELDSQLFKDYPSMSSTDEWKGVYYGDTFHAK